MLPFLFFAWAIIFAHSIVPHHHHSENIVSECNHDYAHDTHYLENSEINNCDHNGNDYTCHFHVEIFTQVSIDNIFLVSSEDLFLNYLSFSEVSNNSYYIEFITDQITNTNYLRGPPIHS